MGKVFLTGATGHLGANLALRLFSEGHRLVILHRKTSYHPFLSNIEFEKVIGDLEDFESLKNAMKGCDTVFHAGGFVSYSKFDKDILYRVNVNGTKNVMEAALKNGVQKVIHTSSTAAVGMPLSKDSPIDETANFYPRYKKIGYMWTKKLSEDIALSYKDKLHVVSVNPSTFLGAGDVKMNTGILVKNIYHKKVPVAPRGSNSVSAVDDIVEGHLLALDKGKNGERYILASQNIALFDLINTIADVLGVPKVKNVMPAVMLPIAYIASFIAETVFKNKSLTPQVIMFSSRNRCYSSDKAKEELGWQPRVSLRQAIIEATNFYKKHNLL